MRMCEHPLCMNMMQRKKRMRQKKRLGKDPAKGVLNGSAGLGTFHRNVFSHDICLCENISIVISGLPKGLSSKEKNCFISQNPISIWRVRSSRSHSSEQLPWPVWDLLLFPEETLYLVSLLSTEACYIMESMSRVRQCEFRRAMKLFCRKDALSLTSSGEVNICQQNSGLGKGSWAVDFTVMSM